jgi:hypothetical protein
MKKAEQPRTHYRQDAHRQPPEEGEVVIEKVPQSGEVPAYQ